MAVHLVFSSLELLSDYTGMQEEVLSAGGSRKAVGGGRLWNPAAVDPLGMASLTAGWGDPERTPAQAPGLPDWRNGVLKVHLHAWAHRTL